MNENLKKEITIRVASEVKQVIDMFSQRSISMIPYEVINFFKKRGTEEENYPVDKNIPLDKQNLDPLTYDCVLMLLEYVKPLIEYKELEPNWKSFSNPYDSIKQYELEIYLILEMLFLKGIWLRLNMFMILRHIQLI